MAKIKRKSEMAGTGCLVQGLGLVLLFFFPFGTVVGVVLLLVGGRMALVPICGNCGNRVEKTSRLCPHCKEALVG